MATEDVCVAGRTAFFGGRWTEPCPLEAIHRVVSSNMTIDLCDPHFQQVHQAGLISAPYLSGPEEAERYRQSERRD